MNPLNTTDIFLAVAVSLLFVAGIVLLVATLRERIRVRKQWGWRA
jgi:hypothetical protein